MKNVRSNQFGSYQVIALKHQIITASITFSKASCKNNKDILGKAGKYNSRREAMKLRKEKRVPLIMLTQLIC